MKGKQIVLILIGVLVVGGMLACSPQQTPEPTAVVAVEQPDTVSAEAFVVPVREASLSFESSGRVDRIKVEEGQGVEEGQLLVELSAASQQAGLAKAAAGLANAQASLAEVEAGATPEEIGQAEASLARVEGRLAELLAGPTEAEIAQAQAAVTSAQARLNQVRAGSRPEEIEAAAARLLQLEAEVRLAQADYDKYVYGEPDVAEPYGVALQKATLAYEAAQAEYNALVSGARPEEVAVSQAGLVEAQAALSQVLAGATAEQIAQAQADVAQAEAALAQVKAGATQEQVAIARAGVQAAEAEVQAAEAELAKTRLEAPFTGVIGAVLVEDGEMVSPGTGVLALGDTSRWQIQTDDLTEIDVVRVQPGQRVQISVDALPDQAYEGQVVRINPQSETKAGDVTYTVLIDITHGDLSKLRWGMTTFVDIQVGDDL